MLCQFTVNFEAVILCFHADNLTGCEAVPWQMSTSVHLNIELLFCNDIVNTNKTVAVNKIVISNYIMYF